MRGVASLERQVLTTPGLRGTVLRYGHLYGPGTGFDAAHNFAPLHVDAAAHAALLAAQRDADGAFNIAEPNDYVSSAKAERVLGWRSDFRLAVKRLEALKDQHGRNTILHAQDGH